MNLYPLRINDLLDSYVEICNSLDRTHETSSDHKINETMYTLVVVSTFFLPLTFLAGEFLSFICVNISRSLWSKLWCYAWITLGIGIYVFLVGGAWISDDNFYHSQSNQSCVKEFLLNHFLEPIMKPKILLWIEHYLFLQKIIVKLYRFLNFLFLGCNILHNQFEGFILRILSFQFQ